MVESLFRSSRMLAFTVVIFRLGTEAAAAQRIAQQAAFLSLMPGFGFSMAATALVGQSLGARDPARADRKSTRLNSSHANISYAVFCLKKKKKMPSTVIIELLCSTVESVVRLVATQ